MGHYKGKGHEAHMAAIKQTLDTIERDDFDEGWDDERGTTFAKEIRTWVRENRPHMTQKVVWDKVKKDLFSLLPEKDRKILLNNEEWDTEEIIAEEVLYTVADPEFSNGFEGEYVQIAADLSSKIRTSLEEEHDLKELMKQWKGQIDALLGRD